MIWVSVPLFYIQWFYSSQPTSFCDLSAFVPFAYHTLWFFQFLFQAYCTCKYRLYKNLNLNHVNARVSRPSLFLFLVKHSQTHQLPLTLLSFFFSLDYIFSIRSIVRYFSFFFFLRQTDRSKSGKLAKVQNRVEERNLIKDLMIFMNFNEIYVNNI